MTDDHRRAETGHQWPPRDVPPPRPEQTWVPAAEPAPPAPQGYVPGPAPATAWMPPAQAEPQTGKRAAPWVVASPPAAPPHAPVAHPAQPYGQQPYDQQPHGQQPYGQPYGPPSTPFGPAVHQQPGGPPPRRSGRTALIAGLVAVWLGVVGAGVFWFLQRDTEPDNTSATQSAPATSEAPDDEAARDRDGENESFGDGAAGGTASQPAPAPTSDVPTPPTAEEAALAELQARRAESLNRVVLDGRWVAQVASKSVGITDPLQTAANGTNTFYAVDILIESQAASATASVPWAVYLLQGTDFGKRSVGPDGRPYWVTLVDEGFSSDAEVEAWCASTFSTLTPEQLANACAARTLAPPHD